MASTFALSPLPIPIPPLVKKWPEIESVVKWTASGTTDWTGASGVRRGGALSDFV